MMVRKPIYPSQDALYHVERIKEFDKALSEGQIPPRLAPTALDSIGYPLFVVNYQTPYFMSEFFLKVLNNAEAAFKATLILSYILSAVFAFILFRQHAGNIESLTGALVFSYLPYRFANIYSRGSLGESTALMFVPLVLLSMHLVGKNKSYAVPLLALAIFGLITSHAIVFMIFLPLFILYPLTLDRLNLKFIKNLLKGSLLGLLASSFQIFPSIFERKYLTFDQNLTNLYLDHFLNIKQVLRIPSPGVNIGTSLQLGLSASLIIVVSFFKATNLKNRKLIFFLFFCTSALALTNSLSIWLWQNLPVLKFVLYPWRFLSLAAFCAAFCSVLILRDLKFKTIFAVLIILFTIFTSRHYFVKPTQFVSNNPTPTLTTENEFDTIWINEKTLLYPNAVNTQKESEISITEKRPFNLSFKVDTKVDNEIIIRKLYFPNWQIKVNNTRYPTFQKDGLTAFNLTQGSYQVNTTYNSDTPTQAANIISIISLLLIGLLFFLPA